jgi:hypothetical protein
MIDKMPVDWPNVGGPQGGGAFRGRGGLAVIDRTLKIGAAVFLLGATAALSLAPTVARAEELTGDWQGVVAGQVRVIVHVKKDAGGQYAVSLESPDQGDAVFTAVQVQATPSHLGFTLLTIGAHYDADWNLERRAWVGIWDQNAAPMPLVLTRLESKR